MRIYLVKRDDAVISTASAETDASAAALLTRGYTRVTCAAWRSVRRANEAEEYRRLGLEDWLERQNRPAPVETAPLGAVMKTKI